MWAPTRDTVPSKYCLTILRLPVQEATREQVFSSTQWFDVLEAITMWAPTRDTVPSKYCLTILRLPVQEATREQVFSSTQWFDVLEAIVAYSNWRFTFLAQEVNSTGLDVFIGWKVNTDPPVIFTQQDSSLDSLLSPLHRFCGPEKPQVINLYKLAPELGTYDLRCEKRGYEERIMEVLTVHGPAETVERNMLEIEKKLDGYIYGRSFVLGLGNNRYYKHALTRHPSLFRELQITSAEGASHANPESPLPVTLTLFIEWCDREGRSNFHDPTAPDLQVPESSRNHLASDFWETRVASKLKELAEQGASVTTWDYEKASIATGRDGTVTTRRGDKIW